jgi:exosortase
MPVIIVAVLMFLVGRWAEIEFVPPLSLVVLLGGYGLHFLGAAVMCELLFPYAFLLFMVPWPDMLVEFISFPMQLISATYAAMFMGLLGVPVTRSGVDIALPHVTFTVAVPCSGMNSLVSLLALAALLAYLSRGALWKRVVLFAAGAPLALLANVLRIVCILLIGTLWGQKAAEGFFHGFSGIALFLAALLGMLAVARLLGLRGAPAEEPHA